MEVDNTDVDGRLVLADDIYYAFSEFEPHTPIDAALSHWHLFSGAMTSSDISIYAHVAGSGQVRTPYCQRIRICFAFEPLAPRSPGRRGMDHYLNVDLTVQYRNDLVRLPRDNWYGCAFLGLTGGGDRIGGIGNDGYGQVLIGSGDWRCVDV